MIKIFFLMTVIGISQEYKIQPGDEIQIVVPQSLELSRTVTVLPDGSIFLPLIDKIFVADLSLQEAQQKLSKKIETVIKNPDVTVLMKSPRKVALLGAMRGSYDYLSGMTLFDLIKLAGGFGFDASITKAYILRDTGAERFQIIRVNIKKILVKGDKKNNILLKPGDTVYIPTKALWVSTTYISQIAAWGTLLTTIISLFTLVYLVQGR